MLSNSETIIKYAKNHSAKVTKNKQSGGDSVWCGIPDWQPQ